MKIFCVHMKLAKNKKVKSKTKNKRKIIKSTTNDSILNYTRIYFKIRSKGSVLWKVYGLPSDII